MSTTQELKLKRSTILLEELQVAVATAVRKADSACESFIGVVIERVDRESAASANWTVKGVKFGKADREKAGSIVETIVERMQQEFDLAHSSSRSLTRTSA